MLKNDWTNTAVKNEKEIEKEDKKRQKEDRQKEVLELKFKKDKEILKLKVDKAIKDISKKQLELSYLENYKKIYEKQLDELIKKHNEN